MNRGFFSLSSLVGLAICLPLSGWSITLEPTGPDSGPTAAASTDETTPAPVLAETDSAATGVNAPATVVSTEVAVPSNLHLNSASTELVKLANSGVDQSVMLSYVTNSTSTFDLGADEIVYLRDIGVAGDVITAMIQHDQELRVQPGTQAVPPPAPEQPAPAPPAPSQPEPQSPAPVEAPLTPPADAPAYSSFYNVLAPYGTWVNVDGYGLCWQPTVVVANPGWSPYWNCGHWVYSDLGWYWYSDYS